MGGILQKQKYREGNEQSDESMQRDENIENVELVVIEHCIKNNS